MDVIALVVLAALLLLWFLRRQPRARAILRVAGRRRKEGKDMPNTQLIEVAFNEEVGLTLGAVNEDGSPGEFEAGSQEITFTGDAYTKPNDGSDGREVVPGVVAWFGTNSDTAEGEVTGSGDADLGSGVRRISDTTPYKAVKVGATTAVLGVFITRPKVLPV